jgi:hypothetical protein
LLNTLGGRPEDEGETMPCGSMNGLAILGELFAARVWQIMVIPCKAGQLLFYRTLSCQTILAEYTEYLFLIIEKRYLCYAITFRGL